jgi:hypothetical protein
MILIVLILKMKLSGWICFSEDDSMIGIKIMAKF